MRLIDADKLVLKHFVQWADVVVGYNGTQPKHKHTDIIAYDISGAPTVKAIPIEWIENYVEEHWATTKLYATNYVWQMLDDWEKMAFHSRRYIREKWEGLKYDMEKVLRIYDTEEDKITDEEISKVKREMRYYVDAIMKEVEK